MPSNLKELIYTNWKHQEKPRLANLRIDFLVHLVTGIGLKGEVGAGDREDTVYRYSRGNKLAWRGDDRRIYKSCGIIQITFRGLNKPKGTVRNTIHISSCISRYSRETNKWEWVKLTSGLLCKYKNTLR